MSGDQDPRLAGALAANEAFYRAFDEADVHGMGELWARQAPVVCVHPGWRPILGRGPVLESWKSILTGPDRPAILMADAAALDWGDAVAVVCTEMLAGGRLAAVNAFVLEDGSWRMVHHQAGPMPNSGTGPT